MRALTAEEIALMDELIADTRERDEWVDEHPLHEHDAAILHYHMRQVRLYLANIIRAGGGPIRRY